MNETTEPAITAEQITAYQRHQAAQEQQAMQACIAKLKTFALEDGFEIVAMPFVTRDGRLAADWGLARKVQ